jgi:8-oxo-dGTP pyrophosphatase MutT (NUDIX family)
MGGARPGESLEAAQRELAEEAGRRAGRLTWISPHHTVFPFAEVVEMVRRAEITDSMTVIAMLHAALRLQR